MQSDDLGLVRYGVVAHDDGSDRMEPVARGQWVRADEAAAAIERLVSERDAALLNKRVCVARLETLTTCGLAEVAMSNATVMRQWGELVAERDEAREALPSFEGVAKTKLDALTTQGWEICGYAIVKDGQFGLVTTGAFVGWWSVAADNADRAEAQRDKLKEALRQIADLDEVESALDPEWTINRARQALKDAP